MRNRLHAPSASSTVATKGFRRVVLHLSAMQDSRVLTTPVRGTLKEGDIGLSVPWHRREAAVGSRNEKGRHRSTHRGLAKPAPKES